MLLFLNLFHSPHHNLTVFSVVNMFGDEHNGTESPSIVPCDEYSGLSNGQPLLRRPEKVEELISKFLHNRFTHVGSPAATGKTSHIQLCIDAVDKEKVVCKYINMQSFASGEECLKSINLYMGKPWSEEYQQWRSEGKLVVVFLDDAQSQYGDAQVNFWECLIRVFWTPPNVTFVVAATYSLSTYVAPISFEYMPRMLGGDLILSPQECRDFLMQSADVEHLTNVALAEVLRDARLQNMMIAMCGGHIGCLKMSVVALRERFASPAEPVTVERAQQFYMLCSVCTPDVFLLLPWMRYLWILNCDICCNAVYSRKRHLWDSAAWSTKV